MRVLARFFNSISVEIARLVGACDTMLGVYSKVGWSV